MRCTFPRFLCAAIVALIGNFAHSKDQLPKAPPPVELTDAQDHARMLRLLGIETLRPGANPRDEHAPNAPNYDESKANPYPDLPDALAFLDGRSVLSATQWRTERRPELLELFDREIYGRVPKKMPKVQWRVVSTAKTQIGAQEAVVRQLIGRVDNSRYNQLNVEIEAALALPATAKSRVPVMIHIGYINVPPNMAQFASSGPGPDWREQLLTRGWGYLIVVPTSVQADSGSGLTKGIIGLVNRGQPRALDDWGVLRAWAWGASRALDYLETNSGVDSKRVGIEGLSRYGKATLVAMAYDERFAIGFIGSSGQGGAKLQRRDFGERVENLAGIGAYHWMAGNYLKYAGPLTPKDLPVDAHELIALCAPRPIFISVGSPSAEGGWVDARGMFMAAVAAGPAYRLLGKRELGTDRFPPMETALIDGDIAFRQHSGGHTTGPNWPTFLDFAARYFSLK